ncbi:MAG TPA: hypothetical protein VNP97_11485, partial [Microbacterium sp.]|nr:hypothetical protein [Microbacterium sp.]
MEKHVAKAAPTRGRLRAAWTLILLAPLCAELAFSAVGMPIMWVAFPFLIPMYGLGVLVVRDLVARAGGGWASLLVMGLVYELAEDGLGLQALTSPTLYDAAEWGPRIFGFNLTYWETQVGYHAVFSVLIPVVLTDLIFPAHRGRPYLRNGGLIGTAIAAVIGIAMLKVVFTSTTDPGYFAPLPFLGGVIVVMFALSFMALRILPGRFPTRPTTSKRSIPRPVIAGMIAGVATLAFLSLLMPMTNPPDSPAIGRGAFVLIPMTVAAIIGIGMAVVIARWNASTQMTDMHRIWLAGGALVGHTLFVIIAAVLYPADSFT